jgi:hypothetical protein
MNLSTPHRCLLAGLLGLALSLPAGAASTIVDTGPPDHLSGQNLNYAFQAEDFSLAAVQTLDSIVFWTLEAPGAYRGSFSFALVGDAGGMPGTTLTTGANGIMATRSATGNYLGLTEYRNQITLADLYLSATPGNYWLVLHNGTADELADGPELLWETGALNASATGLEAPGPNGPWTGTYTEHAFQVSAVPEPGPLSMLLAGIVAVGGLGAMRARGGAQ